MAARIAHTRSGLFIPLKDATGEPVAGGGSQVLENEEYVDNARRLQELMTGDNGLERAANMVEEKFAIRSRGAGRR